MKKTALGILALSGLALTLIPPVLVFTGSLSNQAQKTFMAIGMLLWFAIAPFWIKRAQ
ncbi:MAG: hypothetical protein H6564_09255 [Lewinellaceae bacterium]|nr:hypothetical protein [Lewinellaceae bacterium]